GHILGYDLKGFRVVVAANIAGGSPLAMAADGSAVEATTDGASSGGVVDGVMADLESCSGKECQGFQAAGDAAGTLGCDAPVNRVSGLLAASDGLFPTPLSGTLPGMKIDH
ncbi:hypothetical protein Dimus_030753, partial [Dionaea muscipula]